MNYNINDKKYHYVYKITNDIDDRYYIGKHSTNNLNDNYMGSGLLLRRLFKKYGIEHFKKEIIKMCESNDEAYKYEALLVTNETLKDKNCLNIQPGGLAHKISSNSEYKSLRLHQAGLNKVVLRNIITNECIKIDKKDLEKYDKNIYINPTKGMVFSKESREKMSKAKLQCKFTPWNKGKHYKNPNRKLTEAGRLSIIAHNKSRIISDITRKRISDTVKNRKYMYKEINGEIITKFVKLEDQQKLFLDGWIYGRPCIKNMIVIHKLENNKYINKLINENELNNYIKIGWEKGKKYNKK